jgi:AraC-like DNA-binding protein
VIDVLPFLQIPYIYPLRDRHKFEAVFDEYMLSKTKQGHIPMVILQKAKSLELLYLLLDNALGLAASVPLNGLPPSFLSVLLKIVTQPEARLTLAEIAGSLHMNPTYVSNQFKAIFGKSPILLHREIKIAKARSLLETGDMTINEISVRLGFNDVQTFTRLFKKYTGISPGQYKGLFKARPV